MNRADCVLSSVEFKFSWSLKGRDSCVHSSLQMLFYEESEACRLEYFCTMLLSMWNEMIINI